MNATGLVANVLAGTLVVLLIVYLFVALIRPDKL
ncbi:K(+)-transporting ATPase subunit F [Smaragdicoccus niigatensis]|nr:K(+)-transporting ATPase subunit F [Smaragdicoccus niigatensis]